MEYRRNAAKLQFGLAFLYDELVRYLVQKRYRAVDEGLQYLAEGRVMITIPDAMRRPAEVEREELRKALAEARAEIVAIRGQNLNRTSASLWAIMRHAFMDGAFKGYEHGTEEKLRIQYFNEWCQKNYPEAVDAAIKREELIEQMREAIKFSLIADEIRQSRNVCASDINDACETSRVKRIAALSAAERASNEPQTA